MRQNLDVKTPLLSLEGFKKALDSWNFKHVALHGWGEPLLNPQLFEMVKYAESKGISTELTTNATLLQSNIEEIFASGLRSVVFGIHNKENLPVVMPQIKELIAQRDKEKLRRPRTYIDIVIYKGNLNQILDLVKLAPELNIDEVVLHRVFNIYPVRNPQPLSGNIDNKIEAMAGFKAAPKFSDGVYKTDPEVEYISIQEEKELFMKVKKIARELKIKLYLPPDPSTPCKAMKHSIFVTNEGKITPCPFLPEFYMGDALNEGVKEVIYSRNHTDFLRNMDRNPICAKCPLGSANGSFYS